MIDPHFHFLDPVANPDQHATIVNANFGLNPYLPEDYIQDFDGLDVEKMVHMEILPDDFVEEVRWIHEMFTSGRCPLLGGIVAAADPSEPDFENVLQCCAAESSLLKGIRWILNWDGELQPGETPTVDRATWPRSRKANYFADPMFAANYPLLEKYGLSFDLQCNPPQLTTAANFLAQFPNIPVVLDHIGSLNLSGDNKRDEATMVVWRNGMQALANLQHTYVKLSMLGYTLPGWHKDEKKRRKMCDVVLEVIQLFGTERCMFASNFPVDRDLDDGLTAQVIYGHYREWVSHFSESEKRNLFQNTASRFYRLNG